MSSLVGIFLPIAIAGTIANLELTFQALPYEKHVLYL